jgi:hypothetical protein
MPPAINLVFTRCTDNNTVALERWYNDHAQLLMASPALQSAELFKMVGNTAGIDYFCLYHFQKLSDFAAFDSGEVMAQVRDLSNAAPGRSSIDIVKRTQYERVLHRQWPQSNDEEGLLTACLLVIKPSQLDLVLRWLNDVLYGLHISHGLQTAQVYAVHIDGALELFMLLQSSASIPAQWLTSPSDFAPHPDVKLMWQAQALLVAQWMR